jgi:hypothetical protein
MSFWELMNIEVDFHLLDCQWRNLKLGVTLLISFIYQLEVLNTLGTMVEEAFDTLRKG